MKKEEVVKEMVESGKFDQEHINSISQEMLDEYELRAVNILEHPDFKVNSGNYSGNDFVVSGRYWYWKDTPGSQCGRTKQWKYGPVATGSSYRNGGSCPAGFSWFEIFCVF